MRGIKVTIPDTKKVVLIREPEISDQSMAAQLVGSSANESQYGYALALNREMTRLLLHSIDGKPVDQKNLRLDDHLTLLEFNVLQKVVGKLSGAESPLAPAIESVNIGAK